MKIAKPESMGLSTERLNRIDDMFRKFIDNKEIAGISAIISRKDHIVYRKNFGFADMKKKVKIKDDTIFRIYSMSKPVTVTAALILFERGLYSMDDPISKYIPSFAEPKVLTGFDGGKPLTRAAKSEITIRHLFTMTSGLSYGFEEEGLDKYYEEQLDKYGKDNPKFSLEEFTDLLAGFPLASDPGTEYRYSFSIDVLGRLIEILSGKQLSQFFKDEIFKPLNMPDTGFFVASGKKDRLSCLYEWNGKELTLTKDKDFGVFTKKPHFEMGGGGLVSTIDDYTRFSQMLLHKGELDDVRILGRKTVEFMSANHLQADILKNFTENEARGYGYGLGVRVMMDPANAGMNGSVREWGWSGMAGTWMCIDPEEELTAVFMIQLVPYGISPVAAYFQQMMYSALID